MKVNEGELPISPLHAGVANSLGEDKPEIAEPEQQMEHRNGPRTNRTIFDQTLVLNEN